jgi:ATP/maltotriose-dependent transcriptional regulator MalT
MARGHPEKAIDLYRRAIRDQERAALVTETGGAPGPLWATRSVVDALAKAGRLAEARAIVQQTEQRANSGGPYVREDVIAMMWGLLGDNDRAFAWWERALRAGSAGIGVLYHSTIDSPIRHDPRIRALAKRAGLSDPPPYWP